MGFLHGKRALITGILSQRSIAWGIANAMHREGAQLAFTYVNDQLRNRVDEAANAFGSNIVLPCDVSSDEQIEKLFAELGKHWDGLDIVVHSIGFAPREALQGEFLDGLTRSSFAVAHDISSYSFAALAKAPCSRSLTSARIARSLTTTSWVWPRPASRRTCVTLPTT
jgi:enoyl-[acyl-carrier protein] reductase I